jgi:hypothetical protein
MNEITSDHGLPAEHGIERAAARLHSLAVGWEPKRHWCDLHEAGRRFYRGAVVRILRDVGPRPQVIADLPLFWYSPRWGILRAEREDWLKGARHVVALRPEIVIELPEDAYPMAPIQPSQESLDGSGQPMAPEGSRAA